MECTRLFRRTLSVGGLIGLATSIWAQTPVSTFKELQASMQLKDNESIEITEQNGTKYKAKLAGISEQAIAIMAKGTRRELSESQVSAIRHRRPDKWWNGMLIGLGAGLAAAVVGVTTECGSNDSECQAITAAVFIPTFAGIGMGAGAAIDFVIRKHETVYARSGPGTNRGMRISPILNNGNTGVSVTFGF